MTVVTGLVTTIIPVHNRPDAVREAVASVLTQDYRPIEVILVDDGSDDGHTPEVLAELALAHPEFVRTVRQDNAGPGAARECGRLLASGEFIQYLDSDDVLLPGKFAAQVALLRQRPDADVAYGITLLRDLKGHLSALPHKRTGVAIERMFPRFLNERWWETATPLYRRAVCDLAGPWTKLWLEEDWEYDCRIASYGGVLVWHPQPVSEHRDHTGERLSRGAPIDPRRMRQRAQAHSLIYAHAVRAGMDSRAPEMRIFARSLFLLARHCGVAGLAAEGRALLALARQAAGPQAGFDLRCYGALAALFGWQTLGKVAQQYEKWRGSGGWQGAPKHVASVSSRPARNSPTSRRDAKEVRMAEPPLISIVIPVFNRAPLLRESVKSVLEQDWRPLEVVIVDDGSTDETLAVAHAMALEHPTAIKVISQPNGGPGVARQTGAEHSSGEFVQFLDSDDLLLPGKLRLQAEALLSDPDAGIAYGRTLLESNDRRAYSPENWSGEPTRQLFPGLLVRRFWDTSNPLYRRSALLAMGPWAARRQLEDWEYDCRAASIGIEVHYCDADVDLHRSHAANRLQNAWLRNDDALRDRLWAYREVHRHTLRAGVDPECREFQSFVRTLFLMARLAGMRGLVREAEELFALVRIHASERRLQITAFAVARKLLGWRVAATLGERLRALPTQ